MLVFIDDSGDPGFKFESGSSTHLVIASCLFESVADAEEVNQAIIEFRKSLGWSISEEFKFSKTRKEIRSQFFNSLRSLPFSVRAVSVDKSFISETAFRSNQQSFYHNVIGVLLEKSASDLLDSRIYIDGSATREYASAAKRYFKQIRSSAGIAVSKVSFVDSKGSNLIQLADMIAGVIRRSNFEGPQFEADASAFAALQSGRDVLVWRIP